MLNVFFFYKQKTAYEMRISDWSSDVCSSDLATGAQRAEIKRTTDIYRGQIVDVSASVYTVQLTGTSDKLDSFIQSIGTASILETVRSGVTGIARGDKVLSI